MIASVGLALVFAAGPQFIENDFPAAVAKAKHEKKLVFVDVWTDWCPTCLYMRENVLNRPSFEKYSKDVVFAALDAENPKNKAFVDKYPVDAFPTFLFIDPKTSAIVLRWIGTADEKQMSALIEASRSKSNADSADALFSARKYDAAAKQYSQSTDTDARSVLSMLYALDLAKENESCSSTAQQHLATITRPQERAALVTIGLDCTLKLLPPPAPKPVVPTATATAPAAATPPGAATTAPAATAPAADVTQATDAVRTRIQLFKDAALALLKEPTRTEILADDVSGLYNALIDERDAVGDKGGVIAVGREMQGYLAEQVKRATTPAQRESFDGYRTQAAIAAGEPASMLEPLTLSEVEFPKKDGPPSRLAKIQKALGHNDDAIKSYGRAIANTRRPSRKLSFMQSMADLQGKVGDNKGQLQTLANAIAYANSLGPSGKASKETLKALYDKALSGHEAAPAIQ